MQPLLCSYPEPSYLLFSENVPSLVYYSHLPIIAIALLLVVFVFFQRRHNLPNAILMVTLLAYAGWVFLDSVFWAANRSDVVMFVWSLQVLIEPLVHIGMLYLVQVLVLKRDIELWKKIVFFISFLPLIITVPTAYILSGFDISICLSQETLFSYYTYAIETIYTVWLIVFGIRHYFKNKNSDIKKEILLLVIGSTLFLFTFSWGAITGSFTEDWGIAQWGLIGMPIFAGFLAYLIVRYQVFNTKLIATQAFMAGLLIIIGAQFSFTEAGISRILNGVTFIGTLVIGYFLSRTMKREALQKEQLMENRKILEAANVRLQELDKVKNEFVSFATHQMRSPLVSVKWGLETLMDETASGPLNENQKKLVGQVTEIATTMTNTVNDLLDISKIEQGGLVLQFAPFAVGDLARSIVETMAPVATKKGLALSYAGGTDAFQITGDEGKLRQVIMNLVDNSIKYTETGTIAVSVAQSGSEVTVSITDTGRGFTAEEGEKLFKKFERGSAKTVNKGGSGLGIFLAKKIVDMHSGKIWATSPGAGQGSTFAFTLPINPPAPKAPEIESEKKS